MRHHIAVVHRWVAWIVELLLDHDVNPTNGIDCGGEGGKIDTHDMVDGQIEQLTDCFTRKLAPTTELRVEITVHRSRVNSSVAIPRDIHDQIARE